MGYSRGVRRPSPAFVISIIALVFAMGGTGWAVTQLPKNSVGGKQLKKNAVTSPKIKDGTIATADLAAATRDALKGQKGDTGATGATGAVGAQGAPGPSVGAAATIFSGNPIATGFASLISLGTAATSNSSGPVVVTTPSRLQISASVNVKKPETEKAIEATVRCTAQWSSAGSGTWLDSANTSFGIVSLGTSTASGSDADVWGTIAIEASKSVNPGRFDVRLYCQRSGAGTVILDYAAINVVAIPEA